MKNAIVLLRIAKVWSLISIGFIVFFMIGYAMDPNEPRPVGIEWFELSLFPMGVLVGMILSWKYARTGAVISIVCLVVFYFVEYALKGRFPGGPFFLLVSAPAFLFLIYSLMAHRQSA
ncbi:DUF7670 domain-containing protein [Kosmotoga pacifica]|uniref:DUF7670 domain-containing protein n=1 Tax=Kosmotoga pacifica TaxID=1330330 RepID=A0A0G2ZE21_9BACT|nr:hypothetical protein [Kosmotoga pacifica]AKI97058.1 hypothetical protein IX53_03585 [Kosmotoga pacifica]